MTELQKRMAAAYEANKEYLPRNGRAGLAKCSPGRKVPSRRASTPACSAPKPSEPSSTPWLAFWKKKQQEQAS